MSDSSRKDSSGSQRSFMGRITLGRKQGSDVASSIKKSINHVSDLTKNMGSSLQNMIDNKKETTVFSKGVRELDEYGYEKYNIDEESEIFISKVPERAMFNEGEPVLVRANPGGYVGSDIGSTSASIQVEEPVVQESPRSVKTLFSNVKFEEHSDTIEAFTGYVGEDGKVEHTVTPKCNTDLFSKMASSQPREAPVSRIELEDVPVEAPVNEDVHAEEPVAVPEETQVLHETPVEADEEVIADSVFVDEDSDIVIMAPEPLEDIQEASIEAPVAVPEETQVVAEEVAPMEAPVAEAAQTSHRHGDEFLFDPMEEELTEEPEDDDWMCQEDETGVDPVTYERITSEIESAANDDIVEVSEEIPAVADVAAEVAPMEAPVAEAVAEAAPEETRVEVRVEETQDIIEAPVEAPVEFTEETQVVAEVTEEVSPVEAPVAEAEETIVATPKLNKIQVDEQYEGLYKEGSEPSSAVITDTDVAKPMVADSVPTSTEAEPVARIRGLDEEGAEILPPMTEPTRRRPTRSTRFCFKNGVLQNVDESSVTKKDEPAEELRGPFEVTVDEAVVPEVAEDSTPAVEISDEVADIMMMTVPELGTDEDWSGICRDEDLQDDGCARAFAESIIREEARTAAENAAEAYRAAIPEEPDQVPSGTVTFSFGGSTDPYGSKVCFSF